METYNTNLPPDQRPLNFKDWALYIFVASLPLIGLIMLLVWAFSDNGNIHRREWAKGHLLIFLIVVGFCAIMFFIFGGIATMSHIID